MDTHTTKHKEALELAQAHIDEGNELMKESREKVERVLTSPNPDPRAMLLIALMVSTIRETIERRTVSAMKTAGVLASVHAEDRTTWKSILDQEMEQIWSMTDFVIDVSRRSVVIVDAKIAEGL